jgi:spore germination protein GerM
MLLPVIKNLRLNAKATETEQGTGDREEGAGSSEQGTGNKEQGTGNREQERKENEKEEEKKPQTEKPVAPVQPSATPVVKPQDQPDKKPQTEKPTAPAQPSTPPASVSTPPVKPVETRDRSIYLIQESSKKLVKVNRNLNATLTDSINALLAGPTPDEIMSGIGSFVPEGSRLLSAWVDKDTGTAHLSFNQEFRYNQQGREGCEGQIKQIVWTAMEFPNVKDVQFRIDGNIVDFLSEGVVISKPIGK